MSLFACGSIHQGHERFGRQSRGKQCSFMSLSALLTAQTISVDRWDSTIIDHVLVEGDKMYLNAYNNGLIPREELLSLNNLPTVICFVPLIYLYMYIAVCWFDISKICITRRPLGVNSWGYIHERRIWTAHQNDVIWVGFYSLVCLIFWLIVLWFTAFEQHFSAQFNNTFKYKSDRFNKTDKLFCSSTPQCTVYIEIADQPVSKWLV